jgi:dienelactone hydrolase
MTDLLERLRDALADRYVLERELGRGGMAVVFLAHDRKLNRPVALKVLSPELAASLGTERFLREIEIAARLIHPNILGVHDCGEADGQLYYVMPFVEGESLRDRLNREKQVSIEDALQIAREVADALAHAHSQGIVHRDIKPENILFTAGHAVVSDFGIARALTEAGTQTLTETGLTVGTPAYMSPEQATGQKDIDARSDLYSLGCVLYEMLSGETPYGGPTPQAVIAKKLNEPTPRVTVVRELVPPEVEAALHRALAKTPADRFATAEQFARALSTPRQGIALTPSAPGILPRQPPSEDSADGPARGRRGGGLTRPAVVAPAVLAVIALVFIAARFSQHRADVRWARETALPDIKTLIDENDVWRNLVPPYRLAEQAEAILGDDPELVALLSQISREIDINSDPPGAAVYLKEYQDLDTEWSFLGVTPLEDVRVPIGIFRWKLAKEGYDTILAAAATWNIGGEGVSGADFFRRLDEKGDVPPGMVRVEATETPVGPLGDFYIGRYEVTNREYKEFVDTGGYWKREYWKHPFVRDGRELTWEEAAQAFVDQTGQPGPSTWLGGDHQHGEEDYPVSGVSWYEAAAYAEYRGLSLPTAEHWNVARGAFTPMIRWPQLGGFGVLAPFANFGGQGPVPVGSLAGITAYGAFDMPGNVREWCWNESAEGRIVRGGAWEDNTYEFGNERQVPPMDRSPRNGFRLAMYPGLEAVPATAFGPREPRYNFDARVHPAVTDAIFQVYREQFAYDRTDLKARVEYSLESPGGWIHEKVSFDAAYGDERVLAHLFLPGNASPPYQTVVYFPGIASAQMPSSEGLEDYYEFTMFLSYLVRNGRAVLYPIYKGTFERGGPELAALHRPENRQSYAYTENLIQIVKDLRRSIDYLETREDIDAGRLAYYGMSWGGNLGAIMPAVETRFGASVLIAGGLTGLGRPEASDLTYVAHVRTPTLILNGRYDDIFAPETSSLPMFEKLATPDEHKRIILYETDHIPPRTEYIRETLAWLDRYLGPVER